MKKCDLINDAKENILKRYNTTIKKATEERNELRRMETELERLERTESNKKRVKEINSIIK